MTTTQTTATNDTSTGATWLPAGDTDPRLAWGVNQSVRDVFFDGYLQGGDYEQIRFWFISDPTFRRRAVERFGPHHVVWFDLALAMVQWTVNGSGHKREAA